VAEQTESGDALGQSSPCVLLPGKRATGTVRQLLPAHTSRVSRLRVGASSAAITTLIPGSEPISEQATGVHPETATITAATTAHRRTAPTASG
jgi:hypothetical protein